MKIHYLLILFCITLCTGCNEKKVGDTVIKVSKENSEISVDNFPHGRQGIEGFYTISYPEDFSFQKVNETIYDFLSSKAYDKSNVSIKLRYSGKDQYGKDTLGTWISVGLINVEESKKYADFHLWEKVFGIGELLSKTKANNGVINISSLPTEIKNDIISGLSKTTNVESEVETPGTPYELRDFYEYPSQLNGDTIGIKGVLTNYIEGGEVDVIQITTEDGIANFNLKFNSLQSGKARQNPRVPIKKGDKVSAVCVMMDDKNAILISARVNLSDLY